MDKIIRLNNKTKHSSEKGEAYLIIFRKNFNDQRDQDNSALQVFGDGLNSQCEVSLDWLPADTKLIGNFLVSKLALPVQEVDLFLPRGEPIDGFVNQGQLRMFHIFRQLHVFTCQLHLQLLKEFQLFHWFPKSIDCLIFTDNE